MSKEQGRKSRLAPVLGVSKIKATIRNERRKLDNYTFKDRLEDLRKSKGNRVSLRTTPHIDKNSFRGYYAMLQQCTDDLEAVSSEGASSTSPVITRSKAILIPYSDLDEVIKSLAFMKRAFISYQRKVDSIAIVDNDTQPLVMKMFREHADEEAAMSDAVAIEVERGEAEEEDWLTLCQSTIAMIIAEQMAPHLSAVVSDNCSTCIELLEGPLTGGQPYHDGGCGEAKVDQIEYVFEELLAWVDMNEANATMHQKMEQHSSAGKNDAHQFVFRLEDLTEEEEWVSLMKKNILTIVRR